MPCALIQAGGFDGLVAMDAAQILQMTRRHFCGPLALTPSIFAPDMHCALAAIHSLRSPSVIQ
jgi:hypothetical protein